MYSVAMLQKIKMAVLQYVVIIYLSIAGIAIGYTMIGKYPHPYLLPITYIYGMISPYKGYISENQQLHIEVQVDERWSTIQLEEYWPTLYGEQVARGLLFSFQSLYVTDFPEQKYRELAARVFELEQKKGRNIQYVRLSWKYWPVSTESIFAMHYPPFIRSEFLVQYP